MDNNTTVSSTPSLPEINIIYRRESVIRPIVYLIDEHHHHNDSIDDNIRIANQLIANNNVRLIGLESHYGGYEYDNGTHRYDYNDYRDPLVNADNTANNCLRFEQGLVGDNLTLVGVENEGLSSEIEQDVWDKRISSENISLHVNNIYRSIHFITTLFEEYRRRNINGNLILNCGSNHNSHIQMFIEQRIIDGITGTPASYYRIRSEYFP